MPREQVYAILEVYFFVVQKQFFVIFFFFKKMQMQTSFDNEKPNFGEWGVVDKITGEIFFQDFQRERIFLSFKSSC